MIRLSRVVYIYVTLASVFTFAQPAAPPKVLPAPAQTNGTTPNKKIATLPPTTIGAGTLTGAPGTIVAPGACPPNYLPQYCGMAYGGGTCGGATPVYQCIGQARMTGTFAAQGCMMRDWNCMVYQQQMTQMGCPPGPMQGTCAVNIMNAQRQQQAQQDFRKGALIGLGIGLGATLMPKLLSGMGDGRNSPPDRDPELGRGESAPLSGATEFSSQSRRRTTEYNTASVGMTGAGIEKNCGAPPPTVQRCLQEAIDFRNGKDGHPGCRAAQRGSDQKIVINDYCGGANTAAQMWIFDQGKKCLGKTPVSYGNGINNSRSNPRTCTDGSGAPLPCSEDGCHTTPPGFHITCEHDGRDYKKWNSMGLCALEGQGSNARDILIHYARSAGGNSSHGCSGVPGLTCFQEIQQMVNYGALVYNCFCEKKLAPTCGTPAGMPDQRDPANCQLERNSVIPGSSLSGDSGAHD